MSRVSPARSFSPMRESAISTTRSSSARPTMSARFPSSRTSFRVTTSPFRSVFRASTMLNDSLRTTSWPFWSSAASIWGWSETRIFRPAVKTSTLPSSLVSRYVP